MGVTTLQDRSLTVEHNPLTKGIDWRGSTFTSEDILNRMSKNTRRIAMDLIVSMGWIKNNLGDFKKLKEYLDKERIILTRMTITELDHYPTVKFPDCGVGVVWDESTNVDSFIHNVRLISQDMLVFYFEKINALEFHFNLMDASTESTLEVFERLVKRTSPEEYERLLGEASRQFYCETRGGDEYVKSCLIMLQVVEDAFNREKSVRAGVRAARNILNCIHAEVNEFREEAKDLSLKVYTPQWREKNILPRTPSQM